MTYQKKIDAEYQAEIDAFIAKNGVKQLSNTDNKIAETPSYRINRASAIEAVIKRSAKKESSRNMIKDDLRKGVVVNDYRKYGYSSASSLSVTISKFRKSGWEIETIHGAGYKLIKAGGYVSW